MGPRLSVVCMVPSESPWLRLSLLSVVRVADEVIVNVDGGQASSWKSVADARAVRHETGKIHLEKDPWDRSADRDSEICRQVAKSLSACSGKWTMYLFGNEVLHDDDASVVHWIAGLPSLYHGAEALLLPFVGSLDRTLGDGNLVVRMVRRGMGTPGAIPDTCVVDGFVFPASDGRPRIFRYDRIGGPVPDSGLVRYAGNHPLPVKRMLLGEAA